MAKKIPGSLRARDQIEHLFSGPAAVRPKGGRRVTHRQTRRKHKLALQNYRQQIKDERFSGGII